MVISDFKVYMVTSRCAISHRPWTMDGKLRERRIIFHFPFEISHFSLLMSASVLLTTQMANENCQMENGK